MLAVVSPAKSLDLTSDVPATTTTQPRFLDEATTLARAAAKLKPSQLGKLMGISDALADLNAGRFRAFAPPFTPDNARPAIYTFAGDVYVGIAASSLDSDAIDFAQNHLRILSGLYGVLRPLDLMQPYRLEMGTRLAVRRAKTLYAYWGSRLADALAADMADHADRTLVNLASQEYFGAVDTSRLPGPVLTINFKERVGNTLRFNSFGAKKARGLMARFLCEQRLDRPDGLKDFATDGYRYEPLLSGPSNWLFVRNK